MKYVKLNNGVEMPILGYGVYQIPDHAECERCVMDAIDVGYRSIDTAQAYGNEEAVGKAIKRSSVPREELFVTTKVWVSNAGYENAKKSIEDSMRKLQLEYIDLLLIHWPFSDYYGTYRAMEEYCKDGRIRSIGVSNFLPDRLLDLIKCNEIIPAVNQVEAHVFYQQKEAHDNMKKHSVQMQAWAPFAEGRNDLFSNELLRGIGEKYGKSVAQVALRYLIERDIAVLAKTVNKSRMQENLNVFDFSLSEEDMDLITTLDLGRSILFSPLDPLVVEFATNSKLTD